MSDKRDDIREFPVSADFYCTVSSFMANEGCSLKRLSSSGIANLSGSLGATPPRFLAKVFSTEQTGVSGDVFLFQCNSPSVGNLYGLLAVRGGPDEHGKLVMKTDSFVISADDARRPYDRGYVCYHDNCTNRYHDVSSYTSLRNRLPIDEEIDLSSPQLSALYEPFFHGVQAVKKHLSDKKNRITKANNNG